MLKRVEAFSTMAERIRRAGRMKKSTQTDDEAIGKAQIG
jgi:hypothetical protein